MQWILKNDEEWVWDEHVGELNFFLGLQIKQTSNGTMIYQQKYIKELLKKFGMDSSKPIDVEALQLRRELIGAWLGHYYT